MRSVDTVEESLLLSTPHDRDRRQERNIDKSDLSVVNWFERIPYVDAATPRLSSTSEMNMTKNGKFEFFKE